MKVLNKEACKARINFENLCKRSLANSDYYIFAKKDLDYAIKHSYTTKELHKILSSMGYYYYYRAGKLTIRKERHKRNIRVERALGEEYSDENIIQRIMQNNYRKEKECLHIEQVKEERFIQQKINLKGYINLKE